MPKICCIPTFGQQQLARLGHASLQLGRPSKKLDAEDQPAEYRMLAVRAGADGFSPSLASEPQQLQPPQPQQTGGASRLLLTNNVNGDNEKVFALIAELCHPSTRESALLELSKKREQWDDLALVLWHSFGSLYTPRCLLYR
jgi:hypothetical protein